MSDLYVIPLGPLGVLELPREVYEKHLRPVRASTTVEQVGGDEYLVTARALAHLVSLPVSSVYELARLERIPSVRVGKHVRFNPAAVLAALKAADAVSRVHR